MSNNNHKRSNGKFWGIFFVLAAFLLIFEAVGGSFGIAGLDKIPLFRLLLAATFTIWAITKLVCGRFALTFFPLAFAFMLIEDWIASLCKLESDNIVNNGLLLLCALLLTIGFSILTSDWKLFYVRKNDTPHHSFSIGNKGIHSTDGDKYTFGDYTKYIDSATFTEARISNTFGETNIYFENVDAYVGGGTLYVTNSFGELDVHVPSTWNVSLSPSNTFGEISAPHRAHIEDAPTLTIYATNSFGEISIQ